MSYTCAGDLFLNYLHNFTEYLAFVLPQHMADEADVNSFFSVGGKDHGYSKLITELCSVMFVCFY